jgi:hypothetical protein
MQCASVNNELEFIPCFFAHCDLQEVLGLESLLCASSTSGYMPINQSPYLLQQPMCVHCHGYLLTCGSSSFMNFCGTYIFADPFFFYSQWQHLLST